MSKDLQINIFSAQKAQEKVNLLNLDFPSLVEFVSSLGHKPFRAKQLWQWIHQKGVGEFAQMKNLSLDFIAELNKHAEINPPKTTLAKLAQDKCFKFIFDVGKNIAIESVLIPEKDRLTLCVSTQAGCAMACTFCATGEEGFNRQLELSEIIGQLWQVNNFLSTDSAGELINRRVTNVVLMGMGEPLANYKPTVSALKIFLDDFAYGLSKRRVTVSTCGLTSAIRQLAIDCPVSLAISLHAPNDELRSEIMPVNRRYPIKDLLSACREYLKVAPRSKILIEYVLIKGVNDSEKTRKELAILLKNLACKINIIPFNPFGKSKYQAPDERAVYEFAEKLTQESKKMVIVRRSRGEDIAGACGQLAGQITDIRRKKIPIIKSLE